jgi:hypothetical protein
VRDLQVAVREHGGPRAQRSLGNLMVAPDQVSGKDAVRDERDRPLPRQRLSGVSAGVAETAAHLQWLRDSQRAAVLVDPSGGGPDKYLVVVAHSG